MIYIRRKFAILDIRTEADKILPLMTNIIIVFFGV